MSMRFSGRALYGTLLSIVFCVLTSTVAAQTPAPEQLANDIQTLRTQIDELQRYLYGGVPPEETQQYIVARKRQQQLIETQSEALQNLAQRLEALEAINRDLTNSAERLNRQLLEQKEAQARIENDVVYRLQLLEGRTGGEGISALRRELAVVNVQTVEQLNLLRAKQGLPPLEPFTSGNDDTPAAQAHAGGEDAQAPAPELDGAVEELYTRGLRSFRAGSHVLARDNFRELLDKYPEDAAVPNATYWYGRTLLAGEAHREAARQFVTFLRIDAISVYAPFARLYLGDSLLALSSKKEACDIWLSIERNHPDAKEAITMAADRAKKNCS